MNFPKQHNDDDNNDVDTTAMNYINNDNDPTAINRTESNMSHSSTISDTMKSVSSNVSKKVKEGIDHSIDHWKILVAGQILSFILVATGASSATLHFECNVSIPATQTLFVYLCLAIVYVPTTLFKCKNMTTKCCCTTKKTPLLSLDDESIVEDDENNTIITSSTFLSKYNNIINYNGPSLWIYFLIAILDVETNYFIFIAYRYTTLTSVSVLDSIAIPSAMICSRIFLSRIYKWPHLLGALICLIGTTMNVMADEEDTNDVDINGDGTIGDDYYNFNENNNSNSNSNNKMMMEYPHKVTGDCLALFGGILNGIRDVITETVVKKYGSSIEEYLAMIGIFGTFISIIQAIILERTDVMDIIYSYSNNSNNYSDYDDNNRLLEDDAELSTCTTQQTVSILITYVLVTILFYIGSTKFLLVSEAALLNLSLLTGDLWAVLFSIIVEHIIPSKDFYIALLLILSGVFIYEIAPSPTEDENDDNKEQFEEDNGTEKDNNLPTITVNTTSTNNNNNNSYIEFTEYTKSSSNKNSINTNTNNDNGTFSNFGFFGKGCVV